LPDSPDDVQKWISAGYTPTRYIKAWKDVFRVYARSFPNQYVSLSLGFGLNIDERGNGMRARASLPRKRSSTRELEFWVAASSCRTAISTAIRSGATAPTASHW
jgi:hypothetical protein